VLDLMLCRKEQGMRMSFDFEDILKKTIIKFVENPESRVSLLFLVNYGE